MGFLESLQNSAFGMWVAGAPTIWAYPTILTLHAIGMGMAVGASAVLDLRLLGVAPRMPLAELEGTFRPMWIGFVINAASGVALFIAAASDIGIKPVFYIKLSLTGHETPDVLNYKAMHPAFPHESTGDQFFDEPQWESYRALGEQAIQDVLIKDATGKLWLANYP